MEPMWTAKGVWVGSKSPVEYGSCMEEAQVGETGCKRTGWAAGYRGGGGEGGGGDGGGERLAFGLEEVAYRLGANRCRLGAG